MNNIATALFWGTIGLAVLSVWKRNTPSDMEVPELPGDFTTDPRQEHINRMQMELRLAQEEGDLGLYSELLHHIRELKDEIRSEG